MKNFAWIFAAAGMLALSGCNTGPAHPEEAEVKTEMIGSYCSEVPRYKVELKSDGRYEARRSGKGALATGIIGEKCEGNFKLAYDDEKHVWNLSLEKADKHSNPFVQCPGSTITVWEAEKGYAKAGEFLKMTEPFDATELVKDCGATL